MSVVLKPGRSARPGDNGSTARAAYVRYDLRMARVGLRLARLAGDMGGRCALLNALSHRQSGDRMRMKGYPLGWNGSGAMASGHARLSDEASSALRGPIERDRVSARDRVYAR